MKFSESWLREWVNPNLTREELCHTLTMAGLEVEEMTPIAGEFTGVIIGEIQAIEKHPTADRLVICQVNIAQSKSLSIVCGAPNVKEGMKVPVAVITAVMPNNTIIKPIQIRGVDSEGMLCSASELGLSEESQGLLELQQDAPLGKDVRSYLKLNDYIIDLSITPNRGDCLSVKGIAREIAALTQSPLKVISISPITPKTNDTLPVKINATEGCPVYVGRVIKNVKTDIATPLWLRERLTRSGIRAINPIVDVTNYVMLELGQPMHAFDFNKIKQGINVRLSKAGEEIALLDGSTKTLDEKTLIIADEENPLAIAGVMGGLDSSVTLLTQDIFLESAYFSPSSIARQRQYYNLNSDSAYRFERGIDPTIQREAIERATQLILEITGGEVGPVIEKKIDEYLPKPTTIKITKEKITDILGIDISKNEIESIFDRLHFTRHHKLLSAFKDEWELSIPLYRSDITLPEDIIEEIARLYGYDKIPVHPLIASLHVTQPDEASHDWYQLRQAFSDQGFHEIISYSFIDKSLQALFDPEETPRELLNPITADMAVMRTNLLPGLINTLLYNKSRQQRSVRLFEIGTCFITRKNQILQQPRIGALISGLSMPEQWGLSSREVDFYDLKGNIENILTPFFGVSHFTFKLDHHPALHPGQTAAIYYQDTKMGILGALHPTVLQALDITNKIFVFELDLAIFNKIVLPHFREISKFPEIRRDIALLVNQAIPSEDIQDTIREVVGTWLKDVFIFDVYQGKGVSVGLKSIALALILQHPTRTLVDDEVTKLMERVIESLKGQFGAELRS